MTQPTAHARPTSKPKREMKMKSHRLLRLAIAAVFGLLVGAAGSAFAQDAAPPRNVRLSERELGELSASRFLELLNTGLEAAFLLEGIRAGAYPPALNSTARRVCSTLRIFGIEVGSTSLDDAMSRLSKAPQSERAEGAPIEICYRSIAVEGSVVLARISASALGGWRTVTGVRLTRERLDDTLKGRCVEVDWLSERTATESGLSMRSTRADLERVLGPGAGSELSYSWEWPSPTDPCRRGGSAGRTYTSILARTHGDGIDVLELSRFTTD